MLIENIYTKLRVKMNLHKVTLVMHSVVNSCELRLE
jgi:hypothetical protein